MERTASITINKKTLPIIIMVLFFAFQRQFSDISSIFDYADEIFFIFAATRIIACGIIRPSIFSKRDKRFFLCSILLVIIGVIGNIHSEILNKPFFIVVDIISIFKVLIAYYYIKTLKITASDCESIIKSLAKVTRVMLIIMLLCLVLSHLGAPLGMLTEVRHGIKSYTFLFDVAGNYSKYFYFAIPLLTADLYFSNTLKKRTYIGIALLLWLSTMRSRAFAFVACYMMFAFWFFVLKKKKNKKVSLVNILPVGLLAVVMGWDQIMFYLTSDGQARANMMWYSFINAINYFPIGSGFGTYGSDIAAKIYSPLYVKYGFQSVYGLGYIHTNFANDNYWPMIIGQFGVIGTIITGFLVYFIHKESLLHTKNNKYFFYATTCIVFFLFSSSIASKSYSEFTSITVLMLQAILIKCMNSYSNLMKSE